MLLDFEQVSITMSEVIKIAMHATIHSQSLKYYMTNPFSFAYIYVNRMYHIQKMYKDCETSANFFNVVQNMEGSVAQYTTILEAYCNTLKLKKVQSSVLASGL